MSYAVTFKDIENAHELIKNDIVRTSCKKSAKFSELLKYDVYFKNETEQITACYKERGALNSLLKLSPEQKKIGVIAASAGNHAFALSYHARRLGIPVTVCMPLNCSKLKYDACFKTGANIILYGATFGEVKKFADDLCVEKGLTYINGYDYHDVISGQGTIGLEILEQVPDVDTIVVPIGGGGLIAGISFAVKNKKPGVKIIGVQTELCNSMIAALKKNEPTHVDINFGNTIADGLAVSVVGTNSFYIAKDHVDEMVEITEEQLAYGLCKYVQLEKSILEGGGASSISYGLFNEIKDAKKVVFVLSGSNIDTLTLMKTLNIGHILMCRIVKFSFPYSGDTNILSKIVEVVRHHQAKLTEVIPVHQPSHISIIENKAQVTVEVNGFEHWSKIKDDLSKLVEVTTITNHLTPIYEKC